LTATSARYNNLVTRTYDSVGRLNSESLTVNTFGQTFTVQPGYSVRNEMTVITYPDTTVVNRDYTARGQLQQVRYMDIGGGNHTLAVRGYDAGGRLTGTTYESTLAETRGYTRQDNLVTSINTTTVGNYAYTYDANKNRTAENVTGIMTNWGFTIPTGGHDAEDRLTNWQRNNGVDNQQWNLSLVADWTDTTINGTQELRTHDDAHELTARGAQAITYDPKGNIAQQQHAGVNQNYTWDYDNKLASADTTGDGVADVTYTFDALGRRVSKTTVSTNITIVYVSLGDQEIAEYSFTPVTTTTTTTGVGAITPKTITYTLALLRKYIYATYIDEPITMVTPSGGTETLYYYHQNAQFNVVAMSDIAGNVIERYAYDAYGKPHIFDGAGNPRSTSLFGNAYLYTGRRFDAETQLYYFRGRMYDAELGRFPNRDPAEYPDGYNFYAGYFGMWGGVDPSGMIGESCQYTGEAKIESPARWWTATDRYVCKCRVHCEDYDYEACADDTQHLAFHWVRDPKDDYTYDEKMSTMDIYRTYRDFISYAIDPNAGPDVDMWMLTHAVQAIGDSGQPVVTGQPPSSEADYVKQSVDTSIRMAKTSEELGKTIHDQMDKHRDPHLYPFNSRDPADWGKERLAAIRSFISNCRSKCASLKGASP